MSKTLKLNVSFPMTIVVSGESLLEVQKAREQMRAISEDKASAFTGESKAHYELFKGDLSDEAVLERIYRSGIRRFMREDFLKEITGNEATARLGSVKVSFEEFILAKTCTCEGAAGCTECPAPRWTQTV